MSDMSAFEQELMLRNSKTLNQAKQNDKANPRFTILAVDDMPQVLNTIASILSSHYNVILAKDGWMAGELLKQRSIDLMLLDQGMSEISGLEFLGRIRALPATANLPVVFLTATVTKELIIKAKPLHPAGFLVKPIKPDVLLSTIASILEGKK
jgi:putative two-component system response regulator